MSVYQQARSRIDSLHAADPVSTEGRPAELVYADRMEQWIIRLIPGAPEILRLAARCQHLERWKSPRNIHPPGRAGYLAWRRALYHLQADRARELLLLAGVGSDEAAAAYRWVSKTGLESDPGTRALEDAAVLVFLQHEIENFVDKHSEYPRAKLVDIVRKSLLKITPEAKVATRQLALPAGILEVIEQAASQSL